MPRTPEMQTDYVKARSNSRWKDMPLKKKTELVKEKPKEDKRYKEDLFEDL
jgi:hypothetical protein